MLRHILFLEYVPFFSISSSSHNLTNADLICIYPFSNDQDGLSLVPDAPENIGTLVPDAPDTSSLPMAPQASLKTEDPLPCFPKCARKYN